MWNGKCGIIYGKCVNTHYWGLHGWKKKRNFALELMNPSTKNGSNHNVHDYGNRGIQTD